MKRALLIIFVLGFGYAGYAYREKAAAFYDLVRGRFPEVEETAVQVGRALVSDIEALKQEVITPEPLRRLPVNNPRAWLTVSGTIVETNRHRTTFGLVSLTGNAKLAAAAKKKADDMFAQQYFAHDSPQGVGAGDLISEAGYEFVTVGENLALGNYKDDVELVQAWMDSPGHRENILNSRYTEIGVAVVQGMYEGEKTWMAVQEFGRPLSTCPTVSAHIKAEIDGEEKGLALASAELDAMRAELDRMKPHGNISEEEARVYNAKVNEYNAKVADYKRQADLFKQLVDDYNMNVRTFNACIAE